MNANTERVSRTPSHLSVHDGLPPGFEDLQPYVADWVFDTNDERWRARSSYPMPKIQAFYDATVARAEDGIAYLEQFGLDAMPDPAARLLKLLLAMTHAAIAVEMHGQPRAPDAHYPYTVRVRQGPKPFGGTI